jgi:dethiobiotin synthetase
MNAVFVTGTDTGVGKTLVAGLLARYLREQGSRAITQKWVQTGIREYPSDILTHLELMGLEPEAVRPYERDMSPYVFDLAASPHLAAAHEGARIETRRIIASFRRLGEEFDTVIVEGAGGILVPLSKRRLLIDVVETLDLPVVVVAANKLGAINHTLLTVEALRARDIKVLGIVFNTLDGHEDETIGQDNPQIVKAFARVPILGRLPWSKDTEQLRRDFKPIARKILAGLLRT